MKYLHKRPGLNVEVFVQHPAFPVQKQLSNIEFMTQDGFAKAAPDYMSGTVAGHYAKLNGFLKKQVLPFPFPSEDGKTWKGCEVFTWKPRPGFGLDCLIRARFYILLIRDPAPCNLGSVR